MNDATTALAHGTNHGTWLGEPFAADELGTDVFVHRGDAWRCSLTALTPTTPPTRLDDVTAGLQV